MNKIVSFLAVMIILVSFVSCESDQKQEELNVEKPAIVKTDIATNKKPTKETTTDYTKFFKSTIYCEMEPIIRNEIPNKPQKLYFDQIGCEWIKAMGSILDIEGQYEWLSHHRFSGPLEGISCLDLRNDKTVWDVELSYNKDYSFLDENNVKTTPFDSMINYNYRVDGDYFIIYFSYSRNDNVYTVFGPIHKYSGKLLWVKHEQQMIDEYKIMKEANKLVYRKMDRTEVFVTLDLSTGKDLFSTKLDTKLFTVEYVSSDMDNIYFYSVNNHLIMFTSNIEKSDASEGELHFCTIYHIPTENSQKYWKVTYNENSDAPLIRMPRLLNDYIVIPNYSESKAYFLDYNDGSYINKNNDKLSIDVYQPISIVEMEKSLIVDNGINIAKYDDSEFTNPAWKFEKEDNKTFIFSKIFNNNILLMNRINNETLSFLCLDTSAGTKIWETSINEMINEKSYKTNIISKFITNQKSYFNDLNKENTICFFDSYLLINHNVIDLVSGDISKVAYDYNLKGFDNNLYCNFIYCLTPYLVKFILPTENKVLIYPPQLDMSFENDINKLDEKQIILINSTDKPIDFTVELSKFDKRFDEYIAINPKKLTIKPFSKSFISVKEIKETKTDQNHEQLIFMEWLMIKFNNQERKIMIKVNDPHCDV